MSMQTASASDINHQFELYLPPPPGIAPAVKSAIDSIFTALTHFIATVPLDHTPYHGDNILIITSHLGHAVQALQDYPTTHPARDDINRLLVAIQGLPDNPVITSGVVITAPLQSALRHLELIRS
jgi:hypothetical protein